jgi:hypothetical protein
MVQMRSVWNLSATREEKRLVARWARENEIVCETNLLD